MKKRANNAGSITKLNRKNCDKPYWVRVTIETEPEGGSSSKMIKERVTLGYFASRIEAELALAKYNMGLNGISDNSTLKDVYDAWSAERFKKASDSSVRSYTAALKKLEPLWDKVFKGIRCIDYEILINALDDYSYAAKRKIVTLLSQLYKFAIKSEIIPTSKSEIPKMIAIEADGKKSKIHTSFTHAEIKTLFRLDNKNMYYKMILIMIYTGARPKELFDLKKSCVHLEKGYIYIPNGKTENAERKIPIHYAIWGYVEEWLQNPTEYLFCDKNEQKFNPESHRVFADGYFRPLLEEAGVLKYFDESGEEHEHLPYDCRHTFTTLWAESKLDEQFRRIIQGHSRNGIGEQVYSHLDNPTYFEAIKLEVDKLPAVW